ncbi:MAG: hypothetical protein ACFFB3_08820, partial [Candidatus Hodarchaeota archaeon]
MEFEQLPIDFIALIIMGIALTGSIFALGLSFRLYLRFYVRPYLFLTLFNILILFYVFSHLPIVLLTEESSQDVVRVVGSYGAIAGVLSFIMFCLIYYEVKGEILLKELLLLVFIAGMGTTALTQAAFFDFKWSDHGWEAVYSPFLIVLMVIYFSIFIVIVFPFLLEVREKLIPSTWRARLCQRLFTLLVISIILDLVSLVLHGLVPAYPRLVHLFFVAIVQILSGVIFSFYPTLIFQATPEHHGLMIMQSSSGLPLYHYDFIQRQVQGDVALFTAALTGVSDVVKKITESEKNLQRLETGDRVLLVSQGI